jgi:hypothetical protein
VPFLFYFAYSLGERGKGKGERGKGKGERGKEKGERDYISRSTRRTLYDKTDAKKPKK